MLEFSLLSLRLCVKLNNRRPTDGGCYAPSIGPVYVTNAMMRAMIARINASSASQRAVGD